MNTHPTSEIHLLDHGMVRLVDSMGSDLSIIRAARNSYDAAWRAGADEGSDRRLLRRLWTGGRKRMPEVPKHSTPFESVTATFEVHAPIFVFRQWHRHRTQSYNELSARYKALPSVWYVPEPRMVGRQSVFNKQGRDLLLAAPDLDDKTFNELLIRRGQQVRRMDEYMRSGYDLYQELLNDDWPKELARICLPFAMYSNMFATGNLLNWLKFLSLRCELGAQIEIRVFADAIAELLTPIVPETIALWREAMEVNAE